MADIKNVMAAKLKREGFLRIAVPVQRYFNAEAEGFQSAQAKVASIASLANVPVDIEIVTIDGKQYAEGRRKPRGGV